MTVPRGWTDAQLVKLEEMYRAGKSASQIGKMVDKSRSAVIGMIHRRLRGVVPVDPPRALISARMAAALSQAQPSKWTLLTRDERIQALADGIARGRTNAEMAEAFGASVAAVASYRRDHSIAIAAVLPSPIRPRVEPRKRYDRFLTEIRSDWPQPAEPECTAPLPSNGGVRFLDRRADQCARLLPRDGRSIFEALVCGRPTKGETSSWCAACAPALLRAPTKSETADVRKVAKVAA